MKVLAFLSLPVAALLCYESIASASGPPATAFVDVTVVPMDRDHTLPHQSVIVRGGRITVVGDVRDVIVPDDAEQIDGRGLYLMPGLADMHVHLHSEEDARLFLAAGVTTVRNMRGMPQHLAWKQQIEAGEMLAPRLYSCGPTLDGAPPTGEAMTVVKTPEDAVRRVREQQAAGYDCIKVYTRLRPEVYDAILREAGRLGIPVAGHVPSAVGIGHVLEMRQNSIEHLTGYMAALKKNDTVDPDEILTLARATQATGVWNCTTLVVQQKLAATPQAASLLQAAEMQYVPPLRRALWNPSRQKLLASLPEEEYHAANRGIEVLKKLTLALQKVGAGILLGTDAPSRFVVPGFSIHEELRNLTDAGLTPYEAILAGTRAASEYLRADFGMIATGKRADLLLIRGNPLKDIKAVSRIAGVMAAGRWLPEKTLQQMLQEIADSYTTPRKRFTRSAQLPEDLDQYRYEIEQAGVPAGEERIAVRIDPGGGKEWYGQVALDPPFQSEYGIRLQLDGHGVLQQLRVETFRPEGSGWVEAVRTQNTLTSRLHLPFVRTDSNIVDAVPMEVPLTTSLLASRAPLFRKAEAIPVGGAGTLSTRELDLPAVFNSGYEWKNVTWNIRRLPDNGDTKVFALERVTEYSTTSGRLVLDDAGLPLSLSLGEHHLRRTTVLHTAQSQLPN